MPDETIPKLLAEAEADISRVTGLTQATRDEVSAVREALTLLRTSSSANFPETIVFRVVQQLESAIVGIESKAAGYEQEILSILRRIARRERPSQTFTPATSVTITQTGNPMLTISPGNAPTFGAIPQPVNAGPFTASEVAWSVTGDPGASVAPITTDPTNLSATLTLSDAVVVGASLSLVATITNQDGSTVTATDTLTVVPAGTPPPTFVPATGVAINQLT